jgi:hypothetical protein
MLKLLEGIGRVEVDDTAISVARREVKQDLGAA